MLESILDVDEGSFRFVRRAVPVPADLRPTWRIALLLIIVAKTGFRGSVSLEKLHLLSWAARTQAMRELFIRTLNGSTSNSQFPVRFDPAQRRAINFARGEGLIVTTKNTQGLKIALTEKGTHYADLILKDKNVLVAEKDFLNAIGNRVTEKFVKDLIRWKDKP